MIFHIRGVNLSHGVCTPPPLEEVCIKLWPGLLSDVRVDVSSVCPGVAEEIGYVLPLSVRTKRLVSAVWYGIVGFNVPLDTVQCKSVRLTSSGSGADLRQKASSATLPERPPFPSLRSRPLKYKGVWGAL